MSEERLPFIRISFVRRIFNHLRDEHGVAVLPVYELPWHEKFAITWRKRGANDEQVRQLLIAWYAHVQHSRPDAEWRERVDRIMGAGWQATLSR